MSTIKVLMSPHLDSFKKHESGITRVVEAYFRYLPDYDVQLVKPGESYDLHVAHAGMTGKECHVATLHGIYWTSDYHAGNWEYSANETIVDSLRHAREVTVPSPWVAETIQRDMRFTPHIISHGIEWQEWEPQEHEKYVLWNKNRIGDVCDPTPMMHLAEKRARISFMTTFLPYRYPTRLRNVQVTGLVKHAIMKKYIQRAMVYLSTTKETFCIGILEAMASGVPTLGVDWGGNSMLIEHGITGYLARPNDLDDLAKGLDYCIKHRDVLGSNAREAVKQWDWPSAVKQVAEVYRLAMQSHPYEGKVAVIIPTFNYGHMLERAVTSVLEQTYEASEIVVVDDGSTDNTREVALGLAQTHEKVTYIYKENGGVASARNRGIQATRSEFVCCLDADDKMEPRFLEACVAGLKEDRSLGIAYTGLFAVTPDKEGLSQWPEDCDYDKQLMARAPDNMRGLNQIPTCNVFRREAWKRTGGYKSRYSAPLGAGSEDANLWARIMSIGYGAKKVTDAGLFVYSWQTGIASGALKKGINADLVEPHWLALLPWSTDHKHPFASRATPADNKISHPVRQYDQPEVSIVIPVGPGHEDVVREALDSVESQTFRRWEAIVVWDSGEDYESLLTAYPYVRLVSLASSQPADSQLEEYRTRGTGFARNRGAEQARAPFLVFLDADDKLSPLFLEKVKVAWNNTHSIVYTDYISATVTTQDDLQKHFKQQDILQYIERTQEALIAGQSAEYECERAQRQPEYMRKTDPYHWCLVTCLIPKVWHDEIGGFDESMESFEDVLYHWTMARSGFCYVRLPERLVVYRMYTGTRRERASLYTESGRETAKNMLEYAEGVLDKMARKGCGKCPDRAPIPPTVTPMGVSRASIEKQHQSDENFVLCEYTHPNRGNHHVYGTATRERYGYRGGGSTFLVHRSDIDAQPQFFRPVRDSSTAPLAEVKLPSAPVLVTQQLPPEPKQATQNDSDIPGHIAPVVEDEVEVPVHIAPEIPEDAPELVPENLQVVAMDDDTVDLVALPGINPEIAGKLRDAGYTTKQAILNLGVVGLEQLNVDKPRAEGIIQALSMEL